MPAPAAASAVLDAHEPRCCPSDDSLDVTMPRPTPSICWFRSAIVPSMGYEVAARGSRRASFSQRSDGERNDARECHAAGCRWIPRPGASRASTTRRRGLKRCAPGACGNQLQAFKDLPKELRCLEHRSWDARSAASAADPSGRGRSGRKWPDARHHSRDASLAELKIRAADRSERRTVIEAEVVNDIDWHETHVLLKVAFPLSASSAIRNLRNSLRQHRAADHAQQQLGKGSLRGARAALGRSGQRGARPEPHQRFEVRL